MKKRPTIMALRAESEFIIDIRSQLKQNLCDVMNAYLPRDVGPFGTQIRRALNSLHLAEARLDTLRLLAGDAGEVIPIIEDPDGPTSSDKETQKKLVKSLRKTLGEVIDLLGEVAEADEDQAEEDDFHIWLHGKDDDAGD
jgi:hypothetical protein